jgi:hypothetical protein
MRLLLVLLFSAATCFAQNFSQRGFFQAGTTFYPQVTSNDRTRAVGDALFHYDAFYKRGNSLQFAGSVELRADTHQEVNRDFHISWWERDLRRPAFAVRRLSGMYHKSGFSIELGKQFIRWGTTDILTPTDRFAPRDYLRVVDNEFLPVTAARVSLEKGAESIQAVWSPRIVPSRVPLLNHRWAPLPDTLPPGVALRDTSEFPTGSQVGIRWKHVGRAEFAVSLYQGFNHLPSFNASFGNVSSPAAPALEIQRFYPKLRMAGFDTAIPMRWLTFKAETAYFASTDPRADDYALYVVQLERQTGEWFFVGGYAGEALTKIGTQTGDFSPERGLTKTLLGRAGYTIDTNRSIAVEAAVRQNGDGAWVKFEYSQAKGTHWRVTGNVTFLGGAMEDFLGQYNRNSHVLLILRYSF